jgi:hypothetical protein
LSIIFQEPRYKLFDVNLKLLTSDNDFKDFFLQEQIKSQIEMMYCLNTINLINSQRDGEDYFMIKMVDDDHLILYETNNQVKVLKCELVQTITVNENIAELPCSKELAIMFNHNGLKISGYLTKKKYYYATTSNYKLR